MQDTWSENIQSEVEFWRDWFETKGGEWPQEYICRRDPGRPLQDYIQARITGVQSPVVYILDVGSGPLTVLGKKSPTHTLEITAVDALASEYLRLFQEFKITPLIKPEPCHAEYLGCAYRENRFDIVHMSNALDHCYNPILAIQQMIFVCKPGGYVILSHTRNEGEKQHYHGLHQWNIDVTNKNEIILWNPSEKTSLSSIIEGIETEIDKSDTLFTAYLKKCPGQSCPSQ